MKALFDLRRSMLAAMFLVAFSSVVAFAQSNQNRGTTRPKYDPKTETSITGVVEEVKEVPSPGGSTGTHLMVKVGNDLCDVHVGPSWYLTREEYAFAKGDRVEVTGSEVKYQGADIIIARQIRKDGNTWMLRDAQGVPRWSRGKNR